MYTRYSNYLLEVKITFCQFVILKKPSLQRHAIYSVGNIATTSTYDCEKNGIKYVCSSKYIFDYILCKSQCYIHAIIYVMYPDI